jgi:hypothetical protein
MLYEPFYTHFPHIANKLTRTVFPYYDASKQPGVDFGFINAFCNDKNCDCRRVLIHVISSNPSLHNRKAAVLCYGWEPKSFYLNWFPGFDQDELAMYKGPGLEVFQPQTEYSASILDIFKDMLKSPDYTREIIMQYALMKWKLGMKLPKSLKPYVKLKEACPCESGQTLQHCCGGTHK